MAAITQAISKPISLDETRRRIEGWRETRSHCHAPMPPVLWDAAVAAARRHGLYPTARALRVDYGALKKHLETADPGHALASTTFIELVPGRPVTPADAVGCVIEVDGPGGPKRMRVSGLAPGDLLALVRTVWGPAQ
jgi:hypothetical protein